MDRRRFVLILSVLVVLVAVIAVVFYLQKTRSRGEGVSEDVPPAELTRDKPLFPGGAGSDEVLPFEDLEPQVPRWDLREISLDESDTRVREIARELSDDSALPELLAADGMVQILVTAVDNIAEGRSPAVHLPQLKPESRFTPREHGGRAVLSPESAERYDDLIRLFLSFSPEDGADLYRAFYPLFEEAYRDLGYPEGDFRVTTSRAIGRLLDTPVMDGDIPLEKKVTTYTFTDPELESLSLAQKHLLRMGGENVRVVQDWLRRFDNELGLPSGRDDVPPDTGGGI